MHDLIKSSQCRCTWFSIAQTATIVVSINQSTKTKVWCKTPTIIVQFPIIVKSLKDYVSKINWTIRNIPSYDQKYAGITYNENDNSNFTLNSGLYFMTWAPPLAVNEGPILTSSECGLDGCFEQHLQVSAVSVCLKEPELMRYGLKCTIASHLPSTVM